MLTELIRGVLVVQLLNYLILNLTWLWAEFWW